MKNNNQLAKGCFDYYLKETVHLHATWTTGEGPPDYYLEVGTNRLAVQVGVLEGKSDTVGAAFFEGGAQPFNGSDRERQLAKTIESADTPLGLIGTYGIALRSPPGGFSDATHQKMKDEALHYVEETQQASALLPRRVYDDHGALIACIKKCANRAHSVEVVRSPSLDYFVYEERFNEAYTAVVRALSGAQRVLTESPTGKTSPPVVLVLLDTWLHGRREIYQPIMLVSRLRAYWHSIFVAEQAHKGYFPLEEHERWWKSLTEPDED